MLVQYMTHKAGETLNLYQVKYSQGYDDMYLFLSHVPTLQSQMDIPETFQIEGVKFVVRGTTLMLQSEIDEKNKQTSDFSLQILVHLPPDEVLTVASCIAVITGTPQKVLRDKDLFIICDYNVYATTIEYRKMEVIANFGTDGEKKRV